VESDNAFGIQATDRKGKPNSKFLTVLRARHGVEKD
jgi:hypothetical protein